MVGEALSDIEYRVNFTVRPCKAEGASLYFYHRAYSGKTSREWTVTGLGANATHLVIEDLLPAVPYKGYFVASSKSGNGPIGEVIYFKTPLGRKYHIRVRNVTNIAH